MLASRFKNRKCLLVAVIHLCNCKERKREKYLNLYMEHSSSTTGGRIQNKKKAEIKGRKKSIWAKDAWNLWSKECTSSAKQKIVDGWLRASTSHRESSLKFIRIFLARSLQILYCKSCYFEYAHHQNDFVFTFILKLHYVCMQNIAIMHFTVEHSVHIFCQTLPY